MSMLLYAQPSNKNVPQRGQGAPVSGVWTTFCPPAEPELSHSVNEAYNQEMTGKQGQRPTRPAICRVVRALVTWMVAMPAGGPRVLATLATLTAIVLAPCGGLLAQGGIGPAATGFAPDTQEAIAAWIRQLTDDDFQNRQEAESRLLEIGIDALAALEAQKHSGDHELRLRVARIVDLIRYENREGRIRGFVAGDNSLPGWQTFSEAMGTDEAARECFVPLYRERQATLDRHEDETNPAPLLQELLKELLEQGPRGASFDHSLMSCISLQVLKTLPQISVANELPSLRRPLTLFFSQSAFPELVSETYRLGGLHRKAAIQWVQLEDPEAMEMPQRIVVSLTLDLPEGVPVAERFLRQPNPVPSGSIRDSIRLIGLHGNGSHIKLLARYLDNSLRLPDGRFIKRNSTDSEYSVQVGDVALATMIHLSGLPYQEFGLNQEGGLFQGQLLPVPHSGFADEETRQAAREKWNRGQHASPQRTSEQDANADKKY